MSLNPVQTTKAFENIGDHIARDVASFSAYKSNLHINYHAASLGCAVLTYAMGEHSLEGNVNMIVPGGNLASGLWDDVRTQHLRTHYEKQGIDEKGLKKLWHQLAPSYQATKIRNSSFRLFISNADLVIPPNTNKELIDNLRANGNSVQVVTNNRLGHFGTIILQQAMLNRHK